MRFSDLVGQEAAVSRIVATVSSGRIPHAYIFHGRRGVGKTTAALALARLLQCREAGTRRTPCDSCPSCHKSLHFNHPDIFLIPPTPAAPDTQAGEAQRADFIRGALSDFLKEPVFILDESKPLEHRIRTMRWIKQEASFAKVDGPWKVFVLKQAGSMNTESANAMLKLLEEPNPGTLLVLCLERPAELPDTIKSRCALVRFRDLEVGEITALLSARLKDSSPEESALAARLARGSLTRAAALLQEDVAALRDEAVQLLIGAPDDPKAHDRLERWVRFKDKSKFYLLFDLFLLWFDDLLRVSVGAADPKEGLANADRLADLKTWARRLPASDVLESVRLVEVARAAALGYGYMPLVLYSLMERLPKGLRRGASVSLSHRA
jgi:DNA polymerase-3 subunit delta'